MKLLFLVNEAEALVATQTTTMLIEAAKEMGHDVHVWGLEEALRAASMLSFDRIFIRTSPGRDLDRNAEHVRLLDQLEDPALAGCVINRPDVIRKMMAKDYLLDLPPELVPETVLVASTEELISFWQCHQDIIVKPRVGTRGQGIVRIRSKKDLQAFSLVTPSIAQPFLPSAFAGDARVIIIHGQRLTVDGRVAGILRVPAEGSFLGNLHAGAAPHAIKWTKELDHAVSLTERFVKDWGLTFVGADFCGDKLIELNVFSPGGMYWAEKKEERSFARPALEQLLSQ